MPPGYGSDLLADSAGLGRISGSEKRAAASGGVASTWAMVKKRFSLFTGNHFRYDGVYTAWKNHMRPCFAQ